MQELIESGTVTKCVAAHKELFSRDNIANDFLHSTSCILKTNHPMPNTFAHFGIQTLTGKAISGEQLKLRGNLPKQNTILSVHGNFTDNSTILISKYHVHSPMCDIYSGIGINVLPTSRLVALFSKRIRINRVN